MAAHKCNKEAEIAVMVVKVDEIHKILKGNGQEGLVAKVMHWEGAIQMAKYLGIGGGISGLASLGITMLRFLS